MNGLGQMINVMGGKAKPLKTEFGKALKEFWVFKSNFGQ